MVAMTVFFIPKTVTVPVAIDDSCFLTCPFHSTHIPMFTVLDPLLEFTYHLLSSWRKFALCIQSLLCMLFLFGWPPYPCQPSDMILMEVSQRAYDMIHYISGLYGCLYVCEIYVNLIWYLYLFMLNKFCLSLSLNVSCYKSSPGSAFLSNRLNHPWRLHMDEQSCLIIKCEHSYFLMSKTQLICVNTIPLLSLFHDQLLQCDDHGTEWECTFQQYAP